MCPAREGGGGYQVFVILFIRWYKLFIRTKVLLLPTNYSILFSVLWDLFSIEISFSDDISHNKHIFTYLEDNTNKKFVLLIYI